MKTRKMLLFCFILSLAFFLYFTCSLAKASVWQLDAAARYPSSAGDFWLSFNDSDNDNLVGFDDILDFSGVYLGDEWPDSSYPFQVVSHIPTPTITMPAVDGGVVSIPFTYNGLSTIWTFARTGSFAESRNIGGGGGDMYNYTATELVPIPGAVWLLGSGFIGLVGLRKKFGK